MVAESLYLSTESSYSIGEARKGTEVFCVKNFSSNSFYSKISNSIYDLKWSHCFLKQKTVKLKRSIVSNGILYVSLGQQSS